MATTTCQRCGRRLTNPVSIENEYGPVCWRRVLREAYDAYWREPVGEKGEDPRSKYVMLEPG